MTSCCTHSVQAPAATTGASLPTICPRLDVVERSDAYRVEVEVPGAGKDDVEIRVEKGVLSIGARVPSTAASPEAYLVREHRPGGLVRELRLGDAIDAGRITAEVSRGLLTIHLPKVAAATRRRIELS